MKNNETKTTKQKLTENEIEELNDDFSTIDYLTTQKEDTFYNHVSHLYDYLSQECYGYSNMTEYQQEHLDELQNKLSDIYELLREIEDFDIKDALEKHDESDDDK
ncbi:hypothetical protein [Candidatus Phytoplasma meliae]|uniref:Uncharacterized protein n=1 Tax=Candidatus Phytoplasma meliae TaxID=1848402 RepID=A0ABS5CXY3_9MOLU|nr:hypothetical protein [Candidatus Phytoplasma meliae]MBP5835838.1 hypothetical protein [Candidatus Phytoplasma meliae]